MRLWTFAAVEHFLMQYEKFHPAAAFANTSRAHASIWTLDFGVPFKHSAAETCLLSFLRAVLFSLLCVTAISTSLKAACRNVLTKQSQRLWVVHYFLCINKHWYWTPCRRIGRHMGLVHCHLHCALVMTPDKPAWINETTYFIWACAKQKHQSHSLPNVSKAF